MDDGTNTVTFAYDGNGQRAKKVENGVTTIYIGNYYEVLDPGGANEEVSKYYYASGKRIAMRQGDALYWIHGDHLGSTAVTTDRCGIPTLPGGDERNLFPESGRINVRVWPR